MTMPIRMMLAALALGCAAPSAAQEQGPAPLAVERTDGSTIHYYLERRPRGRQPLLLMLQGSGCDSVTRNARLGWTAGLLAPRSAVLTIDKYGVAPGDEGEHCSPEFRRGNTLRQRVLDALQVVAALRRERWWDGELILFGGSEGGAVAAMLGPLVPETRAVIIWSSGIGLPIGDMIRQALPPPMQAEAERIFAEARANPTGERQWAGASYRWWADAIDLVPARSLAQTPAPVLLIHGTRDDSAVIASARAARDLVVASGKTDFVYREYEGYDHFMVDPAGVDRRAEVAAAAASWLRSLPRR
ncbi:MAG TPA: prolyl oligopeptidase family serine peptidase [Allosphingosinicella sp.]|nr:prolyl oligopeptidase family serine peptidase [Allosphingosinicella sp.]